MTTPTAELDTTPTEEFAQLSLPDDMRFSASTLEQRKKQVRRIVASFDRDVVPSMYRPDIYTKIDEEQSTRPPAEWNISDDLAGSLMVKGCYNASVWAVLNDLETPEVRARKLGQKIFRLFRIQFERYDRIGQDEDRVLVKSTVSEIVENLRMLSHAAYDDLEDVSEGLNYLAQALVFGLLEVCNRNNDLLHIRRSGRRPRTSSGSEPETSLYHGLIHGPQAEQSGFLLDALEAIDAMAPETLAQAMAEPDQGENTKWQRIRGLLFANGAPPAYVARIAEIQGTP